MQEGFAILCRNFYNSLGFCSLFLAAQVCVVIFTTVGGGMGLFFWFLLVF